MTEFGSSKGQLRRALNERGFQNSACVTLDGPAGVLAAVPISMAALRGLAKGDGTDLLRFHIDTEHGTRGETYRTFTVSGYQPEG